MRGGGIWSGRVCFTSVGDNGLYWLLAGVMVRESLRLSANKFGYRRTRLAEFWLFMICITKVVVGVKSIGLN